MRKVVLQLLIFVSVLSISCTKEEHQIRFTNNYIETIRSIRVSTTDLSDVSPGGTSEYKVIPSGDFLIKGQAANGYLEGSGTVSGKGKHKWSIVLNADKTLTMIHDKKN